MPLLPALLCTLFLLTLVVGRAGAADADPRADDRTELIKVFREIEASINAQDVDRMVRQMAPDATVTWLNGEVSRGHAEIKAYYDRMVKGEKRRFWIPAALAYGENPGGGAPGGQLCFDIELLDIR